MPSIAVALGVQKPSDGYDTLVPSTDEAAMLDLADKLAADPTGYDPSLCTACKSCEEKCPNELPVSELMSQASEKWAKTV